MQYGWNIKVSQVHLGFMKASSGLRKQADESPRVRNQNLEGFEAVPSVCLNSRSLTPG